MDLHSMYLTLWYCFIYIKLQETIRQRACTLAVEGKQGVGTVGEYSEKEVQGSDWGQEE